MRNQVKSLAPTKNEQNQGLVIQYLSHLQEIRTEWIDKDPWFAATDVCRILEISNHRDAVSRLDDDEKGVASTDTLGGRQELIFVNESGLYNLIFQSRKPEARRFRKWVTSELLPQLRKTGSYQVAKFVQSNLFETDKVSLPYEEIFASLRRIEEDGFIWVSLADIRTITGYNSTHTPTEKVRKFAAQGKARQLGHLYPKRWYLREDAIPEWSLSHTKYLKLQLNMYLSKAALS